MQYKKGVKGHWVDLDWWKEKGIESVEDIYEIFRVEVPDGAALATLFELCQARIQCLWDLYKSDVVTLSALCLASKYMGDARRKLIYTWVVNNNTGTITCSGALGLLKYSDELLDSLIRYYKAAQFVAAIDTDALTQNQVIYYTNLTYETVRHKMRDGWQGANKITIDALSVAWDNYSNCRLLPPKPKV